MFVKRGFEPAFPQPATMQPLRRQRVHFPHDHACVDIGSAEQFERPRGTSPLRKRRALEHHRARVSARHPQIRGIGAWLGPPDKIF
jgi:hypothetical protein